MKKNILTYFFSENSAQKMKFFIKDNFSKCDQIRRKLRIWSHLLKKYLMENFTFYAVPNVLFVASRQGRTEPSHWEEQGPVSKQTLARAECFANFTGKPLCRSLLSEYSLVSFAKFSGTVFSLNTSGRLLLKEHVYKKEWI